MIIPEKHLPLNILLGVDGSEHARAAVQLLRHLPLPPGSHVSVVGVLSPHQRPGWMALSTALHETQTILEDSDLRVTAELLPGHPAEALTNIADAQQPDLIVVGAKGLRAIPGILLGSVAKQIVEDARWAVLVVRAPYLGLRRVLLVTDGSSSGQHAEAILAQAVETLKAARIEAVGVLIRGDAATEIIEYLKKYSTDLVVAGSRNFGRVKGWLPGSVSRRLVYYARCSVLVVKIKTVIST
jgi:nucleotide-binding universal stress UspA family protein